MMKAEIKQHHHREALKFPKPMISREQGYVVFFTHGDFGVVVATRDNKSRTVGESNHNWELACFDDFHGSVTLTQE